MSVTFPRGFAASGVAAGLKKSGNLDLALVQNLGPLFSAASVFTSNRCQANPVLWSKQVMADGEVSAIVLNSGGANCYTGPEGFQTTHATAEQVASSLGVSAGDVLVCSTGIIGEQLDRAKLLAGVIEAAQQLSESGGESASEAIMTTDSKPKRATVSLGEWKIGGMAKGAGMLAPGLATMLVVITTDAHLPAGDLDAALKESVRVTFNRLDSDGCMSTNDHVALLASGASGVSPDLPTFTKALTDLCADLAKQLQADAEGAAHNVAIEVVRADSEADAEDVARSVARNNLFKTAIYGNDPNWGRILAAVGVTKAKFDPYDIDVEINGVMVSRKGQPDQPRELVDLSNREVHIRISLNAGSASATILTNDLTHEYVEENSAYSS